MVVSPPAPSSSSSSSSSLSSSSFCSQKHDVFLSFRGEDTRVKFTSHLEKKLRDMKIRTYIDNRLEKGDNISDALIEAIRGSKISIIILSVNYATSSWCLDEVLCIVECMKERGQVVIPVFYEVLPTNVRKQSGSYEAAFKDLKKRFKDDKVLNQWRAALTQVANLSGFNSEKYGTDSELVEAIVKDIWKKLNCMSATGGFKDLVGINKSVEKMEELLCIDLPDVRIIGIWGMGGLGKTTLARVMFERLSSQFESRCFLENVREESEKPRDLAKLKKKLFGVLLGEKDLDDINSLHEDILRRKKVLIVLDDVDKLEQLDDLAGDHGWFGEGSRVIVTTRDVHLIRDRVDVKYELKGLNFEFSLKLFNLNAFKKNSPTPNDIDLAKRVVDYCKGIPLALKVLGSFLRSRRRENWEIELDRLKEVPNRTVQNVLKISYDGLDGPEQKVFLDIVCFLILRTSTCRNYVERMLGGDMSLKREIDSLIDKSLIFDEHSNLRVHDLVREMGLEIVRQECIKEPGKRSRLWTKQDCYDIFKNNTGTVAIEGISVDSLIEDVELSPTAFKEMHRLRFLQIVKIELREKRHQLRQKHFNVFLVKIDEHDAQPSQQYLEYLPCALKYLEWESWPFKSMPTNFSPCNLVELRMPYGNLERLWSGNQDLQSLKYVNLCGCDRLSDVSALSRALKLESVDLSFCKRLHHVPPLRFGGLDKSYHKCDDGKCSTLGLLNLEGSIVKAIRSISGCVTKLNLSLSSIEEIPSASIEHLEELRLSYCEGINKNFLKSVCELKSLKRLSLDGCEISEIPDEIRYLSLLEELNLSSNPIDKIPLGLIQQLRKLRKLQIQNCTNLKFLPELPLSLELVDVSECAALRAVYCLNDEVLQHQEPWTDYQVNRRIRYFFHGCPLDRHALVDGFVFRVLRVAAAIVLNDVNVNKELGCPDISICISRYEIPRWFVFQSEGFEICLKLLPQWHDSNFLGFAVAVVSAALDAVLCYLDFTCVLSFKANNNDEIRRFKWNLGENLAVFREKSEVDRRKNMLMWYKYENYHDCRDAVAVSLRFVCSTIGKLDVTALGLRPIYLHDYEKVFGKIVFPVNKIVYLP